MTAALGIVLVLYALSSSAYGAAHWRVMGAASSIPEGVRLGIGIRERIVVPAGLVSAAGALLATAQGCRLALSVLLCAAGVSALLDGAIAAALVVAGRTVAPAIEHTHRLAAAGARDARERSAEGDGILVRLDSARRGAAARSARHRAEA